VPAPRHLDPAHNVVRGIGPHACQGTVRSGPEPAGTHVRKARSSPGNTATPTGTGTYSGAASTSLCSASWYSRTLDAAVLLIQYSMTCVRTASLVKLESEGAVSVRRDGNKKQIHVPAFEAATTVGPCAVLFDHPRR
jgi:hypothetical protein